MRRLGQITEKGLITNFTNYNALVKNQASNPLFEGTVKRQRVIKAQRIGGMSKGNGKRLRYTGFRQSY